MVWVFVKRFFLIVLCALATSLFLLQKQSQFKLIVQQHLQPIIEKLLENHVVFTVADLSLHTLQVTFADVGVISKNNKQKWYWKCKKATCKISWKDLLLKRKFRLNIALDGLTIYSEATDTVAIAEHIQKLIAIADTVDTVPFELKSITIINANTTLEHSPSKLISTIKWANKTRCHNNLFNTTFSLLEGSILGEKQKISTGISGTVTLTFEENNPEIHIDIGTFLPLINDGEQFFIHGTWRKEQGNFTLSSVHETLSSSDLHLHTTADETVASGTIAGTLETIAQNWGLQQLKGSLKTTLHATFGKQHTQAKITTELHDIQYGLAKVATHATVTAHKTTNQPLIITGTVDEHVLCKGTVSPESKAQAQVTITKPLHIPLTRWNIVPEASNVTLEFDLNGKGNVAYTAALQQQHLGTTYTTKGTIAYHHPTLNITGTVQEDTYNCTLNLQQRPWVKTAKYQTGEGEKLFSITPKGAILQTELALALIKKYSQDTAPVGGDGILHGITSFDGSKSTTKLSLARGTVVIPLIYNIVNKCNSTFIIDTAQRTVTLNDITLQLHQGTLRVPHASFSLQPNFDYTAYGSATATEVAIKIADAFQTTLSGNLVFIKTVGDRGKLAGNIIVDHAYCNQNILTQELVNLITTPPVTKKSNFSWPTMHLTILSRSPLSVNTPYLTTQANVRLSLQGPFNEPQAIGVVSLSGGKIHFPYRPLHITQGKLYFIEEQKNEPLIDLLAKGSIKKYQVQLHVTGSTTNPYIILESSPSLTKTQIGALLLSGTENTSLSMMMPTLIMQNLDAILFSTPEEETISGTKKRSKTIQPLDKVKFIPSFTDETGRGGLRGSIEVDVNDRVQALLQKNFNLTEDTKLEVDYRLSDDISLRGTKDERGDLGGEVEFRWKF